MLDITVRLRPDLAEKLLTAGRARTLSTQWRQVDGVVRSNSRSTSNAPAVLPEGLLRAMIADALAKTAPLARDERQVNGVFDVIEPFAEKLAATGRPPVRLIGQALLAQHRRRPRDAARSVLLIVLELIAAFVQIALALRGR